jgi:hypothetical protein
VPGDKRRAVFAYPAEIDAWLRQAESLDKEVVRQERIEATVVNAVLSSPEDRRSGWRGSAISASRHALIATPLLALLAALAYGLVLLRGGEADVRLDKVVFSGRSVQALNPSGKVLWTYSFGRPLRPLDRDDPPMIGIVRTGGSERVLLMAPFLVFTQSNPNSDAFFVLSATGKLLWRRDFNDAFQYGGNKYGPPWFSGAMLLPDETHSEIWVAVDSYLWSTSDLVRLNRDGQTLDQFVNWGHIHALNRFQTAAGSFILAGGISNDCNCAVLAVLREDCPSGSSPPLNAARPVCQDCPEGKPYRYFLFPKSDVNLASGHTYNQVASILQHDGSVEVIVAEEEWTAGIPADWVGYKLSPDLHLQGFSVSDHLLVHHKELEAQGKLNHTVEQCPDTHRPRAVRMWSQEHGWETVLTKPQGG